jgi:hypothetical protein
MLTEVKLSTGGGSILWNQNLLTKTVAKLFGNKIGARFCCLNKVALELLNS